MEGCELRQTTSNLLYLNSAYPDSAALSFLVSLVSGAFFILRELYEVAGMLICEKTGLFNLDRAWQVTMHHR